ncbi:MAG: geranylgeranyl reductase family protein [Halobacteriota archaeon]
MVFTAVEVEGLTLYLQTPLIKGRFYSVNEEYDVIVVGAGPAGSTAAYSAARDCDVLLIEKRQEIGAPVRCAEAITRRKLSTFVPIERKWIAAEITRARIFAPDGTSVELQEEMIRDDIDVVLERKLFDRALARRAARAGAHVEVRTRAEGLVFQGGALRGIRATRRGEDVVIGAKLVIGADGIESQIGRWAGIDTALRLQDIESCAQFLVTNADIREDSCDFFFGSGSPGGFRWAFPKGPTAANIGVAVLGSRLDGTKRPIEYLNEFIGSVFPGGQPLELVVGAAPVSPRLTTIVKNGLMLVGDAAHHNEPILGGGLMNAIESGRLAGETACKAIRKNDTTANVLREYETTWNRSFGRGRGQMYKFRQVFASLSDEELNKLLRSLQGKELKGKDMAGIVKLVLARNPRLLLSMGRRLLRPSP